MLPTLEPTDEVESLRGRSDICSDRGMANTSSYVFRRSWWGQIKVSD